MPKFRVRINGGTEQKLKVSTGSYYLAAAAALATLEYKEADGDDIIEIWCRSLLPHYGPYFFAYDGRHIVSLVEVSRSLATTLAAGTLLIAGKPYAKT